MVFFGQVGEIFFQQFTTLYLKMQTNEVRHFVFVETYK
jgi:hypothetical protein